MSNPLDEIVDDARNLSLNDALTKAPSLITDADIDAAIARARADRAMFIREDRTRERKPKLQTGEIADDGTATQTE